MYDQSGVLATAFLALLEWASATHVSYLDGGIEEWHAAGFHTSTEPSVRKARSFNGTVKPEFVVDSEVLFKLLDKRNVVVLDGRVIDRVLGTTKHEKASWAGRIPGSINSNPLGLPDDTSPILARRDRRCFALTPRDQS